MKDKVKLFVMDVDGTLTDGKIYMGNAGEVCKAFHIKDGMGIRMLTDHGIIPAIITGRSSKIVENRAKELGIMELHQGVSDKVTVFLELLEKYHLEAKESAYIGDDINDLEVMASCGFSFAPADAVQEVKKQADFVLSARGGEGAVREAAEYILDADGGKQED